MTAEYKGRGSKRFILCFFKYILFIRAVYVHRKIEGKI